MFSLHESILFEQKSSTYNTTQGKARQSNGLQGLGQYSLITQQTRSLSTPTGSCQHQKSWKQYHSKILCFFHHSEIADVCLIPDWRSYTLNFKDRFTFKEALVSTRSAVPKKYIALLMKYDRLVCQPITDKITRIGFLTLWRRISQCSASLAALELWHSSESSRDWVQ